MDMSLMHLGKCMYNVDSAMLGKDHHPKKWELTNNYLWDQIPFTKNSLHYECDSETACTSERCYHLFVRTEYPTAVTTATCTCSIPSIGGEQYSPHPQ